MEPRERFHLLGKARIRDLGRSRHIRPGRIRPGRICSSWIALLCLAVLSVTPAWAQDQTKDQAKDQGFSWPISRQTFTIGDKGAWTGTFELERTAHDARAARSGGRVDISYSAGQATIEILEAETVKADGRRIAVTPDKIFDIAPQAARQYAMYSDSRTKSIVFPDVGAGDTVRYVYRLKHFASTWPGFSWAVPIRPSMRVKQAETVIEHAASLPFTEEHHGVEYRRETVGDRVREVFAWSNDKKVPDEPGDTADLDWARRFAVSTFNSYAEIGDDYGRLHAMASKVTPAVSALAAKIVGTVTEPREQARLLAEWVSQNVRYVAVSIGQGTLAPTPADETIVNRYGDCKAQTALLAALLSARGIESEPALIQSNVPRYTLTEVPVADFNHVMLHLPAFDLYVDPTDYFAAFGVLPWSNYDKPVLLAVVGHSRLARTPVLRTDDNVVEVATHAEISDDGHITGTTSERAIGAMASDLKAWMALDLDEARATKQLNFFDGPGTGKWLDPVRNDAANDVSLKSEFAMADTIDLAAGEALVPPPGLRFLARPGTMLMGTHDTPRTHPFPCYAGRQVETLEVAVPAGFKPQRLPRDRTFETAMATYSARYAFHDRTLTVRREFVARPRQQVCTPEQSHEMADLLSRIRRDYASVVLFDRAL
jgi:transglutaminase-like putative cysteine protease